MKERSRKSNKNAGDDGKSSAEMTRQDINMTESVEPIAEGEARAQRALALAGQFHGPEDLAQEHDSYVIEAYDA